MPSPRFPRPRKWGLPRFPYLSRRRGNRRPRDGGEGELVPVEPDKPKDLSGGAAAELEFDD